MAKKSKSQRRKEHLRKRKSRKATEETKSPNEWGRYQVSDSAGFFAILFAESKDHAKARWAQQFYPERVQPEEEPSLTVSALPS